ncbi:MAG: MmgE/PrpD family protein [Erythrobacter sp.]
MAALQTSDLPAPALDAARTFLLDTLAVGVAGTCNEASDNITAAAAGWQGGASGTCRILGRPGLAMTPHSAALVNGFQIHCLEWDGLHEPSVVIALCVSVAAIVSESEASGVRLDDALMALTIGVETGVFFGAGSQSQPKFFRPSCAGLMGAAMAIGRLRGFDEAQLTNLLGMAYSQVSGTMQAHWEGSEALPLQIGIAARAALTAADLVEAGVTAPHDVIDGKFGYFTLIEDGADLEPHMAAWGNPWKICEVAHKPFPAGRATQATLTALIDLQQQHGFGMDDIADLEIHVPPLIALLVGRPWTADMKPGYARLCLEFVAPEMVRRGRIDPRRFNNEHFSAKQAELDAAKVTVILDDNTNPNALGPQDIVVSLHNGSIYRQTVDAPYGSPSRPMSRGAQIDKVAFCFEIANLPSRAEELFGLAEGSTDRTMLADVIDLVTKLKRELSNDTDPQ